jgi:hypothetical protein
MAEKKTAPVSEAEATVALETIRARREGSSSRKAAVAAGTAIRLETADTGGGRTKVTFRISFRATGR